MPRFMISFGANAMDHIPDDEMPAVADDARAVVREILAAGVFVLAGGMESRKSSIVSVDGAITDGPEPEAIGGLTVVNVSSRKKALEWAAKIAVACRCPQEVWQIGHDPELEAMLHETRRRG